VKSGATDLSSLQEETIAGRFLIVLDVAEKKDGSVVLGTRACTAVLRYSPENGVQVMNSAVIYFLP
jgi:hypothetical protein